MAETRRDHDTAVGHGADHADGQGAGHGHAGVGDRLGPIDLAGWAAALGGSLLGLVVLLALYLARGS